MLIYFWLSPTAQAVTPTPDGSYSGANTAEGGSGALFSLTTGTNNTALGSQALYSLTIGSQNTATGAQALKNNTSNNNTADGFQSLVQNVTGYSNTAIGWRALFTNRDGFENTATGSGALYSNIGGTDNTATGVNALYRNTTGSENTANGWLALSLNTTGGGNTGVGVGALWFSTTGSDNTAIGREALQDNTTGEENTAVGTEALFNNTTGSNNTAVGYDALIDDMTGSFNIALGYGAGTRILSGSNNIIIGNEGPDSESDTIQIGDTQTTTIIAGIYGQTITDSAVYVNSSGQLGTATSSRRFKQDIKPMREASDSILALQPVTFHYKKEIDPVGRSQFGLVAEDVEKVNPDLVVRDKEGKPYSVRYDQVNAMLLNEFIKEHRKVEELEATVAQLATRLEEQDAKIQTIGRRLQAPLTLTDLTNR
jgi:hypothetical protein